MPRKQVWRFKKIKPLDERKRVPRAYVFKSLSYLLIKV